MSYTSHGYWVGPGEPTEPRPQLIARCGGPGMCAQCAREALQADEGIRPVVIRRGDTVIFTVPEIWPAADVDKLLETIRGDFAERCPGVKAVVIRGAQVAAVYREGGD